MNFGCIHPNSLKISFKYWSAALIGTLLVASLSAAQLTITTSPLLPQGTVGTPYSTQLTATGGTPPYTWESDGLPAFLTLNSSTGSISGVPPTGSQGSYSFTIAVVDQQSNFASQQVTLPIAPCIPTITNPSPLPPGDIGLQYQLIFNGSGCTGPYSFAGQGFPPGLVLASRGYLSGTPTATGTFNIFVGITDSQKNQGSSNFSLTVNPPPTIATKSPLPPGSPSAFYSQQIAAAGGTPPYTFSIAGTPPGLSLSSSGLLSGTPTQTGTFSFTLGVSDSLGAQTTTPFQVTFEASLLQVTPASLSFSANQSGDSPPVQALVVTPVSTSQPASSFQAMVQSTQSVTAAAPPPNWLSVTPTSGVTPAGLVVHATPDALPAGKYSSSIRVLDANQVPTDVPVSLTITSAPPQLSVAPQLLHFAARAVAPATLVQNLLVSNSGGEGSLGFNASVTGGSSWISLSPNSGQTAQDAPAVVAVSVNTQGLGAGAYRDIVHIESSAGSLDIPVALFVAGNGPILGVNTTGVLFRMLRGDATAASRSVEVLNLGDPTSTINFTSALAINATWLDLGTGNASATATAPGTLPLTLNANALQLNPGDYYALLEISDAHALNSPQYVTVVLQVEKSAAPPFPDPSPAGLFFTAAAGGSQPASQEVTVGISSSLPFPFQVSTATADGGAWLTAAPAAGNTSGSTPASVQVTVNPAGLTAGIYTGSVNVAISGVLASVNVTFVVQPGAAPSPTRFKPAAAGCTPAKLAITETGLVNNFNVPAGWPATLIAQLNDDCGNAVTSGSVVASFSNGDAPLTLRGDSLGSYSATWQPGAVTSTMQVTLSANSSPLQSATALLTGGVTQNTSQPPVLTPEGIVNAWDRVLGGALSPGTNVETYGSGLASSLVPSTGAPPVPVTFNGTQILVGGLAAPLFFLSTGQVNMQIPFELAPGQQYMAVASVHGALTLPVQIDTVPFQPGVKAYDGVHPLAQHALDYSPVNAAHPAKPGEAIILYVLGMGATNPKVASGHPAPSKEPLARVVTQPSVTVDGTPSPKIIFAGLTPGFSGLYQINFTVPANAKSGDLDLVVKQNGVASDTTKLPVGH